MTDASPDDASPLVWNEDGLPRSRLYGDVYFSSADGLAETRAVFLTGCGLPERFAGRDRLVVGELGFGTGLNIAALLDLWRREAPAQARLHIFSIEAHPISREDAARALSVWPELGEAAQALLDHWPGQARGFHRVDLPGFRATLDLAVTDVRQALESWDGAADAWFLDGFSPALNPAMWSEDILAAVAARSAPGARAATFTVAGAVRRGLQAAGFEIAKRPGFGRKKDRLEAWLPDAPSASPSPARLAIIGGGIAAAALARAARAQGLEVSVIDADDAPASGNPAALVTPALDAGGGPRAALPAQAFARAVDLYEALPGAVIARGVLQLAQSQPAEERFAVVAGQDIFEPGTMTLLTSAADPLGEPAGAALVMSRALVIEPRGVLDAWRGETLAARVAGLERHADAWRLLDGNGGEILRADAVIIAAGAGLGDLWPTLGYRPVRGQASWTAVAEPGCTPAAFGGYAIPTRDGVLFGATHDRGVLDTDVRSEDHRRNLEILAKGLPQLAERLGRVPLSGRAATRVATPDHLPLAGQLAEGLFVLSGLGGRGFCLAPLLAEHVVARVTGAPSPLPRELSRLLMPDRFDSPVARAGV
ncbi:MAG: FAD-dependent cmnm(5)s(2)U34 oxidoreductase [Caulobacter sp. 12-67-6]|nr:MAG: FAD-dependent cmnm(5)s(2)U34 oxidoreductase [Caulobacter sp. 12-67-6]OYX70134.1 MAG: FAD-dependent cmnm(5)s(2)U34 oxidoreductase [Caulobacter sp. 32-67-35]OZA76707.1 MAG: FAD-dependent cmnm(5)s(2)U34 oxidoreductase [Caulobacter sp. 39-67-4]HQR88576.1 tRNA (5-methylaminomethyl-2-thiouridine)(34)-methyltransferase MnmD [Caulobacter sp.]